MLLQNTKQTKAMTPDSITPPKNESKNLGKVKPNAWIQDKENSKEDRFIKKPQLS